MRSCFAGIYQQKHQQIGNTISLAGHHSRILMDQSESLRILSYLPSQLSNLSMPTEVTSLTENFTQMLCLQKKAPCWNIQSLATPQHKYIQTQTILMRDPSCTYSCHSFDFWVLSLRESFISNTPGWCFVGHGGFLKFSYLKVWLVSREFRPLPTVILQKITSHSNSRMMVQPTEPSSNFFMMIGACIVRVGITM